MDSHRPDPGTQTCWWSWRRRETWPNAHGVWAARWSATSAVPWTSSPCRGTDCNKHTTRWSESPALPWRSFPCHSTDCNKHTTRWSESPAMTWIYTPSESPAMTWIYTTPHTYKHTHAHTHTHANTHTPYIHAYTTHTIYTHIIHTHTHTHSHHIHMYAHSPLPVHLLHKHVFSLLHFQDHSIVELQETVAFLLRILLDLLQQGSQQQDPVTHWVLQVPYSLAKRQGSIGECVLYFWLQRTPRLDTLAWDHTKCVNMRTALSGCFTNIYATGVCPVTWLNFKSQTWRTFRLCRCVSSRLG